jgi:hypothetical protein
MYTVLSRVNWNCPPIFLPRQACVFSCATPITTMPSPIPRCCQNGSATSSFRSLWLNW